MSDAQPFRFVQLDFPGRLGLDEGRYLVRKPSGPEAVAEAGPDEITSQPSHVLVVTQFGAPRAPRGRLRRRPRPDPVEPGAALAEVPLTRLTVISADPVDDLAAESGGLQGLARDEDAVEALLDEAILIVNRALHAHRAASQNPYINDVAVARALAARIGYGPGDQLAEGRFEDALEIPVGESGRRRRAEMLAPQEQVAAILGGRETVGASETLVLRARADLDASRAREAALQLRAGFEALLAELGAPAPGAAGASPGRQRDLTALEGIREAVVAAANEALRGELSRDRAEEVAEALRICERALRRRRVMAQ